MELSSVEESAKWKIMGFEWRDIYKAKRQDTKEWTYGYPYPALNPNGSGLIWKMRSYKLINQMSESEGVKVCVLIYDGICEIDKHTVCQCIGIEDTDGNPIFEKDILLRANGFGSGFKKGLVHWSDSSAGFFLACKEPGKTHWYMITKGRVCGEEEGPCNATIIGNLIDDPDLLEEKSC